MGGIDNFEKKQVLQRANINNQTTDWLGERILGDKNEVAGIDA